MEHFCICNYLMVRHIDLSWNTLLLSLELMYEKLVNISDGEYLRIRSKGVNYL